LGTFSCYGFLCNSSYPPANFNPRQVALIDVAKSAYKPDNLTKDSWLCHCMQIRCRSKRQRQHLRWRKRRVEGARGRAALGACPKQKL